LIYSDLTPDQQAMLNHLTELRKGIVEGTSISKQLEAAVLLLDLYEAILEVNGILIYENQQKVTEH
jgi:hypothetical protein